MADAKISALPVASTPLTGAEVLPVVQSGSTVQVSVTNLTAGRAIPGKNVSLTQNGSDSIGSGPFYQLQNVANDKSWVLQLGGSNTLDFWYFNGSSWVKEFQLSTTTFIPAVSGGGVNFTANTPAAGMTSQLLNWYEEGTWTPTQGAGLSVGGTFSSAGTYTRIGREVTVYGSLTGSTSIAAAAGNILTAGLPFTPGFPGFGGASNAFIGAGSVITTSGTDVYTISAIANAGGTIYFSLTYRV